MSERVNRRAALRAGALGIAAGLTGCSARTLGAGQTFQSQLDEVRSETERYTDPRTAMEDGFRPSGPVAPGQGWHSVNEEHVRSAAEEGLSHTNPQVVTYDTEMKLAAVEWAVPADAVGGRLDLFADDDGDPTPPGDLSFDAMTTNDNWAAVVPPADLGHGDEVALEWGRLDTGGPGSGDPQVVDIATTPELQTLHAWVHRENPEGVSTALTPKWPAAAARTTTDRSGRQPGDPLLGSLARGDLCRAAGRFGVSP